METISGKIWAFGALVAVAGLLICGCGEGGGAATAAITPAQFVEKASAACVKFHGEARDEFFAYLKSSGGEPKNPDARAAYQADLSRKFVIGVKRRELDEFRALGTPTNDGGKARALIAAFEEGIRKAEENPARTAQDSTESLGDAEKLAEQYGLSGC